MAFIPSSSSVVAFQSDATKLQVTASVAGTIQTDVRSSVAVVIIGGSVAVATANSSVMLLNGTNTIGSVTTLQGTVPWIISSVYGNISGSVAAIVTNTVNVSGSVAAFQAGTHSPSAIGYLYRNDTLASTLGADQTYHPAMGDSFGRIVTKAFSSEDGTIISYVGSVTSGSVTLIQPSAVGKKSYITDFWVANTGSVATLVTFKDGSTSIIGNTIAPAGGGSNSPGIAIPLKTAPSQDLTFVAATVTSVLYVTVKGYQAP